jgi:hypothetical protein
MKPRVELLLELKNNLKWAVSRSVIGGNPNPSLSCQCRSYICDLLLSCIGVSGRNRPFGGMDRNVMKRVSVEAFEDKARPEGGHAVVLFRGLTGAPAAAVYRLRLVDGSPDGANLDQWPAGPLHPIEVRSTPEGVELVIGPEVTQSPLLMPGTAVEIEVAALDARGEFLWPDVTPLTRPKRRGLLGRTITPSGRLEHPRPDAALAGSAQLEAGAGDAQSPKNLAPAIMLSPSEPPFGSRAEPVAVDAHTNPLEQPVGGFSLRGDATVDLVRHDNNRPIETAATTATAEITTPRPQPTSLLRPTARRAPEPTTPQPAGELATGPDAPDAYVTWYPHARGGRLEAKPATPTNAVASNWLAQARNLAGAWRMATMVALGVAVVEILFAMLGSGRSTSLFAKAPVATAASSMGQASRDGLAYDALYAGSTSPRGVAARGVSASRALENAAAALQAGGTARDTDEGAFWLKRYLSAAVGDDRSMRALTQLGAAYAEPATGEAHYAMARQVWEVSGALGDPVAMCFLGRLFENGLGAAPSKAVALQWYERARQSGGCPQLEEAIARVK